MHPVLGVGYCCLTTSKLSGLKKKSQLRACNNCFTSSHLVNQLLGLGFAEWLWSYLGIGWWKDNLIHIPRQLVLASHGAAVGLFSWLFLTWSLSLKGCRPSYFTGWHQYFKNAVWNQKDHHKVQIYDVNSPLHWPNQVTRPKLDSSWKRWQTPLWRV